MLNRDKLQTLIYWIKEREVIRGLKEAGVERPWTQDKTLDTYRFCNVRRRDDRVSRWLLDNVYLPNEDNPNLWFMMVLSRWINWPPAIKELMEKGLWPMTDFDPVAFGTAIDDRVARGEKSYTGAYMITARNCQGEKKGVWLSKSTFHPVWAAKLEIQEMLSNSPTVEGLVNRFRLFYNFERFMAGQVIADMTYTKLLNNASDIYTYAPVGPGSSRGMNWLHDIEMNRALKQEVFTEQLTELMGEVNPNSPVALTAHDLQNCLCEVSKYVRVNSGGARPRSLYRSETSF
jgi:hypothetical protein